MKEVKRLLGKRKEKRREGKGKKEKRRMEMGERKMDEGLSGDFWISILRPLNVCFV